MNVPENFSVAPNLTDAMVADMDEIADWVHQQPPLVFAPSGIKHDRPAKQYRTPGLVTPYSRGISIPSREQGQAAADRNDSIRRGGV